MEAVEDFTAVAVVFMAAGVDSTVAVVHSEAEVAHFEAMNSVAEVCITASPVADSGAAEAIAVDTTVAAGMDTEVDTVTEVAGDLGLGTIRGTPVTMAMRRMPVITAIRVIRTPTMDVRHTRTTLMAMHRAGTGRPTTKGRSACFGFWCFHIFDGSIDPQQQCGASAKIQIAFGRFEYDLPFRASILDQGV